jgi:hypothetical protein
MYAGTTIGKYSGRVTGAHQRIDRLARKNLANVLPTSIVFPAISEILHFEGNNGPDSVKRKSPSIDEPWHYINPNKEHDVTLIDMINDHVTNLARALADANQERAAFEAAWLAHAVVDGLTPAHHFPLADKIHELFGMPHDQRLTVKEKNLIIGSNRRDTVSKNWEYWGGKGIFSSHILFEWGIATSMVGRKYPTRINENALAEVTLLGYETVFRNAFKEVVAMDSYQLFIRQGWTLKVSRIVHRQLMPLIIDTVTLAWYAAYQQSKAL